MKEREKQLEKSQKKIQKTKNFLFFGALEKLETEEQRIFVEVLRILSGHNITNGEKRA